MHEPDDGRLLRWLTPAGPAPPPAGEDGERTSGSPASFWAITEVRLSISCRRVARRWPHLDGRRRRRSAADVFFLAAIAVGGWTFVPEALRGLVKGQLGVGTLMTITAIGAVILGELGEAASLAFLFSISEALEGWAMARTRSGLRALLELVPPKVTVRRNGDSVVVDPGDLVIGDLWSSPR